MREYRFRDASELSHAYIIASPSSDERERAAVAVASAALCSAAGNLPCGVCRSCRKVREGVHPDLIRIEREDSTAKKKGDAPAKKKEISVDQVRAMIQDSCIAPNESERKVYIVEEAELMNLSAQNAALKLLEEPPAHVVILLKTANADAMLTTVRSRCTEINCNSENDGIDDALRKISAQFVKYAAMENAPKLMEWCMQNNGLSNADAASMLLFTTEKLTEMLAGQRDALGMSGEKLYGLISLCTRCTEYLKSNVGVKHIFALLATQSAAGAEETRG